MSSTSYRNGIIPVILWGPCLLFRPKHTTLNIRTFLVTYQNAVWAIVTAETKFWTGLTSGLLGPNTLLWKDNLQWPLKLMASQEKTWIIHLQACLMLSRTFLHVNVQAPDSQSYESFMLCLRCQLKMSLSPRQTHTGVRFYFVHACRTALWPCDLWTPAAPWHLKALESQAPLLSPMKAKEKIQMMSWIRHFTVWVISSFILKISPS